MVKLRVKNKWCSQSLRANIQDSYFVSKLKLEFEDCFSVLIKNLMREKLFWKGSGGNVVI